MQTCPKITLLEALSETGSFILASPEDADYFRKASIEKKTQQPSLLASQQPPAPLTPPQEKVLPPPSLPNAKPASPPQSQPSSLPDTKQSIVTEEKNLFIPSFDKDILCHLFKKIAPELSIIEEVPDDLFAKKVAERWKTKNQIAPISVLSLNEPPEQKEFLEAIVTAISVCFGPAKIIDAEHIEKEKQWETFLSSEELKTVIACDYTLWQLSSLMQFYRETPAQGTRMLKNTPIFLLPDLSLYLKDFSLKRSLWKALCQKFS